MRPWRVAQARALGTSHLADNIPCQDSHLVDFVVGGERAEFLLVAVADGAGSASHSQLGSAAACNAAMLHLKSHASELTHIDAAAECVRQCFAVALAAVEELAGRENLPVRQLATTLTVAVVGEAHSVFAQVGDGAVVWGEPGELKLAHWPEQAALNVTDFLTSGPLNETLHVTVCPVRVRRVACMTDGLTGILLHHQTKGPHSPVFETLFTTCAAAPDPSDLSEDLVAFLESPQVNRRTDDDKTLVLAIRDAEAGA